MKSCSCWRDEPCCDNPRPRIYLSDEEFDLLKKMATSYMDLKVDKNTSIVFAKAAMLFNEKLVINFLKEGK